MEKRERGEEQKKKCVSETILYFKATCVETAQYILKLCVDRSWEEMKV